MWFWIHDSQRWWAAALWATLEGCCFVCTAAGGSHPWLFAACELEPFWLINKLPGVFNDLVQVAAFTFSGIMKRLVYMWPTHGNRSKTKPIILLLQYYFGDWKVCLSQKLNVFLFWMQKGLCSHSSGSRSWFYLSIQHLFEHLFKHPAITAAVKMQTSAHSEPRACTLIIEKIKYKYDRNVQHLYLWAPSLSLHSSIYREKDMDNYCRYIDKDIHTHLQRTNLCCASSHTHFTNMRGHLILFIVNRCGWECYCSPLWEVVQLWLNPAL